MYKMLRTMMFWLLACLASFGLLVLVRGENVAMLELQRGLLMLVDILPQLGVGLALASLVGVLVSRERVAAWLGRKSGFKGIALAACIGAVLPGGPFASFPLLFVLAKAGADIGTLISLLVAWATIGLYRLLIWELPLMGAEFATLRFLASVPLPILAGLLARLIVRRMPHLAPRWTA